MAAPKPSSWQRTTYLTTYNTISATLWSYIFLLTLTHLLHSGPRSVHRHVEPTARWTQTLALLDILHSATHLIPAPLPTTFTQVFTRLVQVCVVWARFPASTAAATRAFPALLLAWSAADAVRFVFLTAHLWGKAPRGLVWVRYSLFIALYPVGIAAEWWLMFGAAREVGGSWAARVFYFLLALYVPGAYMMFTYMLKQRRRVLAKANKAV